jgi:hypothetical protein
MRTRNWAGEPEHCVVGELDQNGVAYIDVEPITYSLENRGERRGRQR